MILSAKQTGILVILLLLTGAFSAYMNQTQQGSAERLLQGRVAKALASDSALQNVEPVFEGLHGRLEGVVSDPSLIDHSLEVAQDAASGSASLENRVRVAEYSARIQAEFEGKALVLRGEVSDQATRDEVISSAAALENVEEVRDELSISSEVRRAGWAATFVEFLPRLAEAAPGGIAEATDSNWSLGGEAIDPQNRQNLVAAWEKIVPAGADLKLEQLTTRLPKQDLPTESEVPKPENVETQEPPLEKAIVLADPIADLAERLQGFTVYFPVNSSHMDEREKEKLVQAANAILAFQKKYDLELVAFNDQQGDVDYNLWLSNKRASRVRDALQAQGVHVQRTRVETEHLEQGAGSDEADERLLQKQRRVELRLVSTSLAAQETQ